VTSLPAVVVELSPAQETALNLALNKIRGDWDYEKLAVMLAAMDEASIAVTGFTELEAQSIVEGFAIDETEIAGAGSDGVIQDIRNRTEEEVQKLFGATEKVQFGMFSKAIPTDIYEKWVASLIEESELGESPVALGAVVARRLGIDVTASAEPEVEESLNTFDGTEGEEVEDG
jgi:hypothetical protein